MSQKISGYINYIANEGDTYDSISLSAYNDEKMAWNILQANPYLMDIVIFEGGERLIIPVLENAETPDSLPPWRR